MKEAIKQNLENPKSLEELYRNNKNSFKSSFYELIPEIDNKVLVTYWQERLNYSSPTINFGTQKEMGWIVLLVFLAGLIAKIPDILQIEPDLFYQRNVSFVVFPALITLFIKFNKVSLKSGFVLLGATLFSALFINGAPFDLNGDTLILSAIHLVLLFWFAFGFVYTSPEPFNNLKRVEFLKFNGDLVVMGTVIAISGVLLTLLTVGLFELIKIQITEDIFKNTAMWGLPAIPLVASFLVYKNPDLVKNVSPVIAKIFTPLVLIMLSIYLVALIVTQNDPYNDRNALLTFNLLLIGVMAIILFSVINNDKGKSKLFTHLLLLIVSILTIIINGIALSAIIFRISEWGFTPNRFTVLGFNLLILMHLLKVSYALFKSLKKEDEDASVLNNIASYLPIYAIWALFITFILPLIFSFK
jgi:hypothetical protein